MWIFHWSHFVPRMVSFGPASTRRTLELESSVNLLAKTQPAEPAPIIIWNVKYQNTIYWFHNTLSNSFSWKPPLFNLTLELWKVLLKTFIIFNTMITVCYCIEMLIITKSKDVENKFLIVPSTVYFYVLVTTYVQKLCQCTNSFLKVFAFIFSSCDGDWTTTGCPKKKVWIRKLA